MFFNHCESDLQVLCRVRDIEFMFRSHDGLQRDVTQIKHWVSGKSVVVWCKIAKKKHKCTII